MLMSNKEALEIVLKMAKDRNMTGYDIMYDGQEAEVKREQEALNQMKDYYNDVMEDNTDDSAFPPMED